MSPESKAHLHASMLFVLKAVLTALIGALAIKYSKQLGVI